jgi:hypothetical protein
MRPSTVLLRFARRHPAVASRFVSIWQTLRRDSATPHWLLIKLRDIVATPNLTSSRVGSEAAVSAARPGPLRLNRPGGADDPQPVPASRREIFETIYTEKLWGAKSSSEFFSGPGSRGEAARHYVTQMASVLRLHLQRAGRPLTVVDVGCGDFHVGQALVEAVDGITYVGCDIVPAVIEHNTERHASDRVSFRTLDIVTEWPPHGDVCLVRQVFQHLSNADITAALTHLDRFDAVYVTDDQPAQKSGAPNPDKATGPDVRFDWDLSLGRGVELSRPPFSRQTVEVFRSVAPLTILVTEQVFLKRASQAIVSR